MPDPEKRKIRIVSDRRIMEAIFRDGFMTKTRYLAVKTARHLDENGFLGISIRIRMVYRHPGILWSDDFLQWKLTGPAGDLQTGKVDLSGMKTGDDLFFTLLARATENGTYRLQLVGDEPLDLDPID